MSTTTLYKEFADILHVIRDAVILTDMDGMVTGWNPGAQALFGYENAEILGGNVSILCPEDLKPRQSYLNRKALGSDTALQAETEWLTRSGERIPATVTLKSLQEEGRTVGLIAVISDLRERIQAEEQVRLQNELLAGLFENMLLGVTVWAADRKLLLVNKSFTDLTGYTLEDVPDSRAWIEMVYPDPKYRQLVLDQWAMNRTANRSLGTFKIRCKDGVLKDVEYRGVFLDDDRLVVTLDDVTERLRMHRAMQESEKRYRDLYEGAPVGIFRTTPGGRYISTNPHHARMFGYDSAEDLISSIHSIGEQLYVDNADREKIKALLEEQGEITGYEVPRVKKTGEAFWTATSMRAVRDNAGKILYYDGFSIDITARRQTEQALEQRILALTQPMEQASAPEFGQLFNLDEIQELQDTFAKAANVASIITHIDGTPITRPSNFTRLCSDIIRGTEKGLDNCCKSDAILGQFHPDGPKLQPCLSAGLWDAGANINVGGQHIANWIIGQVRNEDLPEDDILCYASEIGVDPEEFRRAFDEVPRMSNEQFRHIALALNTLARQVSNMAYQNVQQARFISDRKRAERNLIEARDAAEAASNAKSEFLANMSHEIRTPLNGVLGMLQLLQTTSPDAEQHEYIDSAVSSARRLTRLLSDILDLSKVEAGKLCIDPQPFDIFNLGESVRDLFATTALDKDLRIELMMDNALPRWVVGDEARLRQILFNLVGNAVKFTQLGVVHLHISPDTEAGGDAQETSRQDAAPMYWVHFSVSDTGIGIPEEQMEEIFAPFSQVNTASTRRYDGAGLGLAIVRRLVDLMGGDIQASSNEDGGTTMSVRLPFFHATAFESAGPASSCALLPPMEPSAPLQRSLNLLLAEDDKVNSISTTRLLEKAGHKVTLATNGKQVLERLGDKPFDCILMDVQMPILDGVKTTHRIRTSPRYSKWRTTPIIALTAYAMLGDQERFLEAGMDAYLPKPLEVDALMAVLAELVFGD